MAGTGCSIGVVGFSQPEFDKEKALEYIIEAFDDISSDKDGPYSVVSGLTDLGVPAIAYKEADKRNWKTVGVACSKANDYDVYPCDETIIEGKDWGDESDKFLSMIDILVRVGGGKQSKKEVEMAKSRGIKVLEYELVVD